MILLCILAVLLVASIIATEVESFGWATLTLIAGAVATHFLLDVNVLRWVSTHALDTGIYVLCYLGAGVLWSFLKWFSFLLRFRDKSTEAKADLQRRYTRNHPDYDWKPDLGSMTPREFYPNAFGKIPQASNNKKRIIFWMSLFPVSIIGTLLNDPVRRLFKFLFNRFHRSYQFIADKVFGDLSNEK